MRSIRRTLDRELVRDIGLVCLAGAVVAASFGAIAVSSGFPLWLPMLMSLLVFAGAAQFLFVGIVASGGNPAAAVLAGLLVNARHIPFGFAVGELLGTGWARRVAGTHLMVDETVAFALAEREGERRRAAYWTCGIGLFLCWNVGVVVGGLGGTAISDPAALGLDAAFPAVLLALLLPSLRDPAALRATLVGVAIALATAPFLPPGLPVLLALGGVLTAFGTGGKRPRRNDGVNDKADSADRTDRGTLC
ncbi:AzlC family ABC transporter permease [Amycolatopsis cihanbeyliensis]|uniref:4-azaleucine resistance transporter AzlC n=1 Tax=Amycolatopsis cihanbeyliensis TaxID=1128664 RepID=A0A542DDW4_AMYCI|nr:AzlC family ABC transporter permease [Amycolatopsis cihanbeyliensis]TQJ01265.1 4-azaleucine resistance transporter AzlC [Amycolatopsis cihanbeyliensis]